MFILGLTIIILPHRHSFEGSLIVRSLSFTTTTDRLFLKDVSLQEVTISGKQNFSLIGNITNYPNQNSVEITLPNENSQLTFIPQQKLRLTLKELRLQSILKIWDTNF